MNARAKLEARGNKAIENASMKHNGRAGRKMTENSSAKPEEGKLRVSPQGYSKTALKASAYCAKESYNGKCIFVLYAM